MDPGVNGVGIGMLHIAQKRSTECLFIRKANAGCLLVNRTRTSRRQAAVRQAKRNRGTALLHCTVVLCVGKRKLSVLQARACFLLSVLRWFWLLKGDAVDVVVGWWLAVSKPGDNQRQRLWVHDNDNGLGGLVAPAFKRDSLMVKGDFYLP